MGEMINYEKFPWPKYFKEKREGLGQEKLDIEQLVEQTGSQDPALAEKSKRLLREKWDLDPEKDAENAPSIDIMKQLESFSEEEKKLVFSQLVGIQLTEGCNGNCPFCLFGKKKGVEAKYSFESLSAFIKKYGTEIAAWSVFYWDSDPFDYRDKGRNFLDVYKVWREVDSSSPHFISTSIPRGGEQDFVNFIRHTAGEWRSKKFPASKLNVRISLAKHNAQRVEVVFEKLASDLSKDGFSEREINEFFEKTVLSAERFESQKLGQLIGSHEDIRDIYTPACSDGILITPRSLKAIMLTSPTMYEPSGEKNIEISKGNLEHQTPMHFDIDEYSGFNNYEKSPIARAERRRTMPRRIFSMDGEIYTLENPVEDIVLKLGREAASYGRIIQELAGLPRFLKELKGVPESGWRKFLNGLAADFRLRLEDSFNLMKRVETLIHSGHLSPAEKEKIEFYILLSETYSAEMDFLADQIKSNQPLEVIGVIAAIFRHVGREQVSKLPKIIKELLGIQKIARRAKLSEEDLSLAKVRMSLNLSIYFGLKFPFPKWLMDSVDLYCNSLRKNAPDNKKVSLKEFAKKFLLFK